MANDKYTRIFAMEQGALQSWSKPTAKVLEQHGNTHGYAADLTKKLNIGLIAWEHSDVISLTGDENRIAAIVRAVQEHRTFVGWTDFVPEYRPLQRALEEIGLWVGTEASANPVGPRKPPAIICPEVWHTKPFDPAVAWAATMQACKGGS